jgi:hypothetical protein
VETTAIKERPILFSGPMVRAILDGRKTQTRRIVKGKGTWDVVTEERGAPWPGAENDLGDWQDFECPYGDVGDRLWVREAWAQVVVGNQIDYLYRADTHTGLEKRDGDQKWKPSIHMPRVACRLMLEITGVRVERLNEISQQDAVCEGAWENNDENPSNAHGISAVRQFEALWESINGLGSWSANPWVWVVKFKRV